MKKTLHLPDTNYVLRYLLRDVEEQFSEASRFFETILTGKSSALISEAVLVECQYILMKYYQVPRGSISSSLTSLLQYKGMIAQERDVLVRSLAIFAETSLDPVDCLLAARAESTGSMVMTFDKALKARCKPPQPSGQERKSDT